MITNKLLPSVKDAVNRLPYGRFSIPQLDLAWYSSLTGAKARGFGKQFFDSAKRGFLDTTIFRVIPVDGTKNPQMYEKRQIALPPPAPAYPLETLLKDATVEQAMARVFEINFERLAKHYSMPVVSAASTQSAVLDDLTALERCEIQ
jgi:hypothetical protein